ncbi:MAG: haloacid dehalogenase type II [Pseudomonadota bacterium]
MLPEAKPSRSPPRATVAIKAVMFDTFGTVVDFYHPFKRLFEALANEYSAQCDAAQMAIDWRTAYLFSVIEQASGKTPFRTLRQIHRENLDRLLAASFPVKVPAARCAELALAWEKLEPWPDAVEGLKRIRRQAIIAPLSNGNFADMARLSKYAGLPWDIILGASVAGHYKPHPQTYLQSVAALDLTPEEVLMVAAHQPDLAFAAGHGMQTAFVPRPLEFGGAVKPANPTPGESYLDAAEVYPEEDWTFVATDFIDLAAQLEALT